MGRESPYKTKTLNFPFSVGYHPHQKVGFPCPSPDRRPHIWKKVSLIVLRQILVAYIFSNTITTNLIKLIGNKFLNTKQCPAGLCPRIISLNFYGNPGNGGEYQLNAKNLIIFPTRKILLNKFTSSAIKNVILSPSNSNFHLIILYKLHL